MSKKLEKEFKYFLAHQSELVEEYNEKYIVIIGHKIIDAYDSEIEAIEKTKENYDLGTFLVQLCLPREESYTRTFHSRVAFA